VIRLGRGKWKGHILRPPSKLCRPTSSMLRAAFIDIAGMDLVDSAVVWDLCAGSGAVGLEALSSGASHCVFIDTNRRSTSFILRYLRKHDAIDDATVITGDIKDYITELDSEPDIIFIDPPYRFTRLYEWIASREWSNILKEDGVVFVESGTDVILGDDWNRRKYGDCCLNWKR